MLLHYLSSFRRTVLVHGAGFMRTTAANANDKDELEWREWHIHDRCENEQDDEFLFNFFSSKDDSTLQTNALEIKSSVTMGSGATIGSSIRISIRDYETFQNSTGLSLCRGAYVLAQYLIDHPQTVCDKVGVVELGAGVGLCGLLAHLLGARRVVLTDGDTSVLENMRYNVKTNIATDTGATCSCIKSSSVSCHQLIWGRQNAEAFVKRHGKQSVILGSDILYMIPSLEPLWQTVDELLPAATAAADNQDSDSAVGGVFVYAQASMSHLSVEEVLNAAQKYGFVLEDKRDTYEGLFVFRRGPQSQRAQERCNKNERHIATSSKHLQWSNL